MESGSRKTLLLKSALVCLLSLGLPVALKRWTHSFHLSRCVLPLKEKHQIFSLLEKKEVEKILSRPFHYLDRGAQSFVFESEDGRFVLKLFFFDPHPKLTRPNSRGLARKKAKRTLEGCKTASLAHEETALVYLHLGQSDEKLPIVRLIGPAWKRSWLNCSHYCFAIQERAVLLKESLQAVYLQKNQQAFQRKIRSLSKLLKRRIERNIHNSDPGLFNNFGFVDCDRAIEIDFGNYRQCPDWKEADKSQEEARYLDKLALWMDETMPEWKELCDKK